MDESSGCRLSSMTSAQLHLPLAQRGDLGVLLERGRDRLERFPASRDCEVRRAEAVQGQGDPQVVDLSDKTGRDVRCAARLHRPAQADRVRIPGGPREVL
jgi:hypothetical protein